jgi:hypothetical protein
MKSFRALTLLISLFVIGFSSPSLSACPKFLKQMGRSASAWGVFGSERKKQYEEAYSRIQDKLAEISRDAKTSPRMKELLKIAEAAIIQAVLNDDIMVAQLRSVTSVTVHRGINTRTGERYFFLGSDSGGYRKHDDDDLIFYEDGSSYFKFSNFWRERYIELEDGNFIHIRYSYGWGEYRIHVQPDDNSISPVFLVHRYKEGSKPLRDVASSKSP